MIGELEIKNGVSSTGKEKELKPALWSTMDLTSLWGQYHILQSRMHIARELQHPNLIHGLTQGMTQVEHFMELRNKHREKIDFM